MIRIEAKPLFAALCLAFAAGPGLAQSSCPCTPAGQLTAAELVTLLSGKMVCAESGSEKWQEWHNSATGEVTDYKRGPADAVDPSEMVGSYAVNVDDTVSYTYGGATYKYAVCPQGASALYAFCGAAFGGRDITGVLVGGSGLQSCSTVTPASNPSPARKAKPKPAPGSKPVPPVVGR